MNSARDTPKGWVSPFGHPRINDRSHLPAAFRSVPRPSSPLGAKASTECPSLTPYPHHRPRTGPNHAPCNYQPFRAAAPATSPASRSNSAGQCASLTHTTDHLHHMKEHAVPQATRFPSRIPDRHRGTKQLWKCRHPNGQHTRFRPSQPARREPETPPARHRAAMPRIAGRFSMPPADFLQASSLKENGDGRIRTDDPLLAKQVLSH